MRASRTAHCIVSDEDSVVGEFEGSVTVEESVTFEESATFEKSATFEESATMEESHWGGL